MGECWHNNHHAFPGSAKLGIYPGEWDPGWWTLRAMQGLGLVSALRLPQDLPARPELIFLGQRSKPYDARATESQPSSLNSYANL
jgi:stearoyl-CoA desaturase (delta-9 desaturase)